MATDQFHSSDSNQFSLIGLVAFIVVVALFLFVSTKAGTRGMGAGMIACAIFQQMRGRIAYGWEGKPPAGHITGWPATLLNLLFGFAGLAAVVWPEVAMGILGWDEN